MNTIPVLILPLHIEIFYSYLALDLFKGLGFYYIKHQENKLKTNAFKNPKIMNWKIMLRNQTNKMQNTMSDLKILSLLCFVLPIDWLEIQIKVTKRLCLTGFLFIVTFIGILQKSGPVIVHRLANVAQENFRVFL